MAFWLLHPSADGTDWILPDLMQYGVCTSNTTTLHERMPPASLYMGQKLLTTFDLTLLLSIRFIFYLCRGVDVLFCGQTHRIKKFVLRTNVPGHLLFNSYLKCNFRLHPTSPPLASFAANSKPQSPVPEPLQEPVPPADTSATLGAFQCCLALTPLCMLRFYSKIVFRALPCMAGIHPLSLFQPCSAISRLC